MHRRLLASALISLIAFMLFLFFCGCNPEKALIRKEDKAFGVVVGSDRVFPKAGARWLQIHPCVITTPKPDVIITKIDTILQEKKIFIPVKITEYKNRVLDTIIEGISVYADSNGLVVKNLNGVITKTNTVTKTVIDQTLADNQRDTINSLRIAQGTLQGQIIEKDKYGEQQKARGNKLLAWAIGLGILALIFLIVIIYMIFKGGVLSIFKKK